MRKERKYDFRVGDKIFHSGTHIMAILNVTPDSFYAGSRHAHDAVETAKKFLEQGAEIIDIGGQSTRPGAQSVSALEEMSRVLPAVESIKKAFPDALVSVDTFYPDVAQAAIDLGADMINDVSCLADKNLAKVVAQNDVAICVMHDRRKSKTPDLFFDKETGLIRAIDTLLEQGLDKNRILLDGGIGFNKSKDEDWQLLNDYGKLLDMFEEYPFLLGTSRKSMIGLTLDLPVTEREEGTIATSVMGLMKGCRFFRVHNVKGNARALQMAWAIMHS